MPKKKEDRVSIVSRLYITVVVAWHAAIPLRVIRGEAAAPAFEGSGPVTFASPQEISLCLRELSRYMRLDGTLSLFFTGCMTFAAPCLLFRLKREGYSAARAVVTNEGLHLTARR